MPMEVLIILWILLIRSTLGSRSDSGSLSTCIPSGIKYNDHCVWNKSTTSANHGLEKALGECSYYGGKLLKFESLAELNLIRGYLKIETGPLLIGVKRTVNSTNKSEYFWLDGKGDVTEEAFFAQPSDTTDSTTNSGDCLSITSSTTTIVDCDSELDFICQYKCVVANANTCVYFGWVLDNVFGKSNLTSNNKNNITTTTTEVTMLDYDILSEIIQHQNISNTSPEVITKYIEEVHQMVTNSNKTVSTSDAMVALVKLSKVAFVTENSFLLYAESMSHVLSLTSASANQTSRLNYNSDVLVAMENMMCAVSVDETDVTVDEFDIKIRTVRNQSESTIFTYDYFGINAEIVFNSGCLETEGRISTILYNDLDTMLPNIYKDQTTVDVSSNVISVTVQSLKGNLTVRQKVEYANAVNFTLPYFNNMNNTKNVQRICSYWDVDKRVWSGDGCYLIHQNDSYTSCSCDHLTSFAVLVMYYNDEDKEETPMDKRVLHIVSAVGCSLSIFGLSMTIFIYIYLRILGKDRVFIHTNLAVALLLGQLVFVVTNETEPDENPAVCKLVAILLHFFFLSAFTWMLVEGLVLYVICTRGVYYQGDTRLHYIIIGWGLPVVIVLISFGAEFQNYGDGPGDSCWLSFKHGLIWAFMGPMLVIVFFNMVILGMVLNVFLTLKANKQKSEAARVRASLRAMVMLLPLLGMTWILSLLVPFSTIFEYLFVIGNSLQGMLIFFLHCLCNEEVRSSISKRRLSALRTTDTDISIVARRKSQHGSFDGMKPKPFPRGRRHAWI